MIGEEAKYGSTTFMKGREFNGPNKIMIVTNQPTGNKQKISSREKANPPPRTAQSKKKRKKSLQISRLSSLNHIATISHNHIARGTCIEFPRM